MRTILALSCIFVAAASLAGNSVRGASNEFLEQVRPILRSHCFGCHGEEKQKADLRLDTLGSDINTDRVSAERWHDVLDALRRGDMPPKDAPELPTKSRRVLVDWISRQVSALIAERQSTGGRVVLRRLNRTEYRNTMSDLLGIECDYAKDLPPESLSEDGFLNNGSSLRMSDLLLEYYLDAARDGLRKAIVTGAEPQVHRFEFEDSVQDKNRGGRMLDDDQQFVAKLMEYPSEGEFLIRVKARAKLVEERGFPQLRVAVGYRADVQAPRREMQPVDVSSTDWRTFEFRDRIEHYPLPSKSQSKFPGLLIWLDNAYAEGRHKPLKPRRPVKKKRKRAKDGEEPVETPRDPYPVIEVASLEFVGPVFDQWPPVHHTSILFPSNEYEGDEAAYVSAVLRRFMERAFRRPVANREVTTYQAFYQTVRRSSPSLQDAIRETLAMVLISPDFLYLVEPAGGRKRALTDWELAARLSYFLWSTMPDERLFELARTKRLHEPDVLREEVTRMIADDRSRQFVKQFAEQWLDVSAVDRVAVNPEFYPDFDNDLKRSMREETLQFFSEVFYQNESALNFLDSDFVMLNESLAKHYGLKGPRGDKFERIALSSEDHRGGVLAHASILLGNSTGADSHPVKRAVWIRERLLDDPPADPPPNVPTLDSTNPDFASLSVREQLRLHREEQACNDCHRGIDPWGIALENYGADGLWRDEIPRKPNRGKKLVAQPVITNTTLPDGHELAGLKDLKAYLLRHRRAQFARAFTSKLLAYALGRGLEVTDTATLDELTDQFVAGDYRIADLIRQVVISEPFQSK